MNKIYIILRVEDYDGSEIIEVLADKDWARTRLDEIAKNENKELDEMESTLTRYKKVSDTEWYNKRYSHLYLKEYKVDETESW